jgi:8-oxo-dGTP pyrophosphatase MutT (NUDIX family)
MRSSAPEAALAGTVALLRDRPHSIEVLMLQRASSLEFAPSSWVFPGGRAEEVDHSGGALPGDAVDEQDRARRAAAREAFEEAGVRVTPEAPVAMARWTPPEAAPRRFSTWLFAGAATTEDVVVDGGEITRHWWGRPVEVLERHRRRELDLLPPTWIALNEFAKHQDVASALHATGRNPPVHFRPVIVEDDGIMCCVYGEDAEYPGQTESVHKLRHRLTMDPSGWRYERTF